MLMALIICSISLLAAGCVAPAANVSAPAATVDIVQTYKLGTGDRLRLIVFDEPTLSGEFAINAGGSLALPLIGSIAAAGHTTVELTESIRAKLAGGYLRDPRVSIDVLTYRPFYILGEVMRPGEYPYSIGLTVMNAVAKAQGFTYRANERHIFIKAADSPRENEVALTSATEVHPGDTIRIAERYF
jgi:polysaccharide export outer membrane protein